MNLLRCGFVILAGAAVASIFVPSARADKPATEPAADCPADLSPGVGQTGEIEGGKRAFLLFVGTADYKALPKGVAEPQGEASVPITREQAARLKVKDDPRAVAVYLEPGFPICVGQPGDYYLARRDADGAYLEIRRKIEGCAIPASSKNEDEAALMMRSTGAMDRCPRHLKRPIGFRAMEWPSPEHAAPVHHDSGAELPAEIEALVPRPHMKCGQDCIRLWSLAGDDLLDGSRVYELIVSWTHLGTDVENLCNWPGEDWNVVAVRARAGAPLVVVPHAADVAGIFPMTGGGAFIVTTPLGQVAMYEARPDAAPVLRQHFQSARVSAEETPYHSMREYCGP